MELNSLRDALNKYNVSNGLMPNWIPEGYICVDISTMETPKARTIFAKYERRGEQLVIQIRQTIGTPPQQIEKNEDLIEIYTLAGVDYYIFSNNDALQTAWIVGEFECIIGGKVTMEEMKEIIDSI